MSSPRVCSALSALSAAIVAMLGSAAIAETIEYTATLAGTNEVPAISGNGRGSLTASYNTETKVLSYTANYSDLTGPVTAAHFHGASDASHNAPVMLPVTGNLGNPMKGSAVLNEAQAAALTDGRMYFNVHTEQHKPGEIRGQLVKSK